MKYKYIVLDFGKVITSPTTGHWDITPKFIELIDINKIDKDKFNTLRKKYSYILNGKITTLEEEYDMFKKFYNSILSEFNISKDIIEKIAYDRTYNHSKYKLYNTIYDELNKLKEKYKLILLTDNWPCVIDYLKEYKLYDYFEKIYISSFYGMEKNNPLFFDNPINDFNIKPQEALFIDDNESNLDNAVSKGFDVMLMDREKEIENSKYKIINDLFNI